MLLTKKVFSLLYEAFSGQTDFTKNLTKADSQSGILQDIAVLHVGASVRPLHLCFRTSNLPSPTCTDRVAVGTQKVQGGAEMTKLANLYKLSTPYGVGSQREETP
jgi:hypothetical protein